MAAKVKISFVKQHSWHRPLVFLVYHEEGPLVGIDEELLTGFGVRLWRYQWEKAGFGHGRFGYGSFGWAQGGVTSGGFGFGRFGEGEFGYYNEVVEYVTPKAFKDGQHTFEMVLLGSNNQADPGPPQQTVLIMSEPEAPKMLSLTNMTAGQAQVRWVKSYDLT